MFICVACLKKKCVCLCYVMDVTLHQSCIYSTYTDRGRTSKATAALKRSKIFHATALVMRATEVDRYLQRSAVSLARRIEGARICTRLQDWCRSPKQTAQK